MRDVSRRLGPSDEIEARYPDADRVDGRGRAVFPGMVNCHTHMLVTADRGILEDFGFPTTLRFPTTGRGMLDPEERNVFGLLAAAESIRSGGTDSGWRSQTAFRSMPTASPMRAFGCSWPRTSTT